jgi:hypothetical protein
MKEKTLYTLICLFVLIWFGCTDSTEFEDFPEEIPGVSCGELQADTTIVFSDFPTKLYFTTPLRDNKIAPAIWLPPAGILIVNKIDLVQYSDGNNHLRDFLRLHFGAVGNRIMTDSGTGIDICNFPDKVLYWNRKNLYEGNFSVKWEGEVDVVLGGIIYANRYDDKLIVKYLELSLIKKIKTRK